MEPILAENQVQLSTGEIATINAGTGQTAEEAQELLAEMKGTGQKVSLFSILMMMLVEIDGKKETIEYYRGLKMGDFMAIQGKIAQENF